MLNKIFKFLNTIQFKMFFALTAFGLVPLGACCIIYKAEWYIPTSFGPAILILAFIISSRLSFPFKHLADEISSFTEGHYDKELNINGSNEVWLIEDAINEMLTEFALADKRREEFVSNVSHELKTPLASMKVLSDSLLQAEDAPKEDYIDFMRDINESIDRENRIISNLLTLSKLSGREDPLQITTVNINSLVEKEMRDLKPLAESRNIEMVFESFKTAEAEVDEVKISLIVKNLVENAIKYNVPNGKVTCSVNADHKYFVIKVSDTGIGIPDEDKKRIFDRFYRVDKARSRESGGTGLGLSIVREAVLLHHGSIRATNNQGAGTLFTVKLPLSYRKKND